MQERFSRTQLLLGNDAMEVLKNTHVAIFGIGGVGGYVAEALARAGVGAFDLIDPDRVCNSNINRQIIATSETIGRYKTEAMRDRILSINPSAEVTLHECFYLPENKDAFHFAEYSYIIDAVDTVTAKLTIIEEAKKNGVMVISCMGAGNKLDPTMFEVADISKTSVCPLAKVMRRELKKRNISHVKVVYSKEQAIKPQTEDNQANQDSLGNQGNQENQGNQNNQECQKCQGKRQTPGSISFVPSVAGLIIAGEVVRDICKIEKEK